MKKGQKGFSAVEVLIVLFLLVIVGAAVWYVTSKQKEEKSTSNNTVATVQQNTETTKDESATENTKQKEVTYEVQNITSGLGRFTVSIPTGWNELLRPMDSNSLYMREGTKQPVYIAGQKVTVTDLDGFGSDGQRVFRMFIHDNIADPEGSATAFEIPNNGKTIKGNKHSIVYQDTLEGLGGHKKGEKAYSYRFKLDDGYTLAIGYNVYAEDMNDQSEMIDFVVRSIILNK